MPSIFPEVTSGGLVVRDENGVCQSPANVQNAYCPPATFNTTCEVRALPSDCTARITAAQINAFQSEMLCLAATLTPDGTWNCGSLCNLSSAFAAWMVGTYDGSLGDAIGDHVCNAPLIAYADIGNGSYALCDGNGNLGRQTPVELATGVVQNVCATAGLRGTLSGCLISTDAGNVITQGSDNRLLVRGQDVANSICGNIVSSPAQNGSEFLWCDNGTLTQSTLTQMLATCYAIPMSGQTCNVSSIAWEDLGGGCGRIVRVDNNPLPSGIQFLVSSIFGTHVTPLDGSAGNRSARIETALNFSGGRQAYEILPQPAQVTLSRNEFCALSVAGIDLALRTDVSVGHFLTVANYLPEAIGVYQLGATIAIDGVVQPTVVDFFALNTSGANSNTVDIQRFDVTTTGNDITIEVIPFLEADTAFPQYDPTDEFHMDMAQVAVTYMTT